MKWILWLIIALSGFLSANAQVLGGYGPLNRNFQCVNECQADNVLNTPATCQQRCANPNQAAPAAAFQSLDNDDATACLSVCLSNGNTHPRCQANCARGTTGTNSSMTIAQQHCQNYCTANGKNIIACQQQCSSQE